MNATANSYAGDGSHPSSYYAATANPAPERPPVSGTVDTEICVVGAGYSGPTVADGLVYVTDRVVEPKEIERVHCFNWWSGERVW